jgi:hypothetical protein
MVGCSLLFKDVAGGQGRAGQAGQVRAGQGQAGQGRRAYMFTQCICRFLVNLIS